MTNVNLLKIKWGSLKQVPTNFCKEIWEGQVKRCQMSSFDFSEHYSMSSILPKDSSKVSYTQKLFVSKKFDNFAKITLRVTETGPSRIEYKITQY